MMSDIIRPRFCGAFPLPFGTNRSYSPAHISLSACGVRTRARSVHTRVNATFWARAVCSTRKAMFHAQFHRFVTVLSFPIEVGSQSVIKGGGGGWPGVWG